MGQFEDMHAFIRIVDAGGISRASEQMDVAKSALSRRLVDLEKRLGVRLLNRTTRSWSLTEAGQSYYDRALRILDDVDELNAMTADANCRLEGTIRMAAPLSFGLRHLTPAIDLFCKEHPGLKIEIDFSDRQIDLIEEGVDLAFRITDLKDSTMVARRISPIRLLLCASPGYINQYGQPRKPADLKQHDFLQYDAPGRSSITFRDKQGNDYRIKLNAKLRANNGEFLRDMAISGHGLIVTPTFISWQAIATGELVPLLTDYHLPMLNAYAVYPQSRFLSQRVRMLIEFLAERFGDNPYWEQNLGV